MDRLDLDEDMEALMARFLNGLNTEIAADKTDLQPYSNIEELLHIAIKIERQIQRRSQRYSSKTFSNSTSTQKKDINNIDYKHRNQEINEKPQDKFEKGESSRTGKEKVEKYVRNKDLKCWRCQGVGQYSRDCPNARIMTIKEGEIVTDEEAHDDINEETDESEDFSEEDPTHVFGYSTSSKHPH